MTFETSLLRAAFFRCLQDGNNCASGNCARYECDCAVEMQAYLDEAREHITGSSPFTPADGKTP